MKTITVKISEPTYRELQEYARRHDRKTSELIREVMEAYRRERIEGGPGGHFALLSLRGSCMLSAILAALKNRWTWTRPLPR